MLIGSLHENGPIQLICMSGVHSCILSSAELLRGVSFCKNLTELTSILHLEAKKIVGTYMGENSYASVAWRADTTNQDNKYRALIEKLIELEMNDWPMIQKHLKNYTQPSFTKHQLSNRLGMGRDPML